MSFTYTLTCPECTFTVSHVRETEAPEGTFNLSCPECPDSTLELTVTED